MLHIRGRGEDHEVTRTDGLSYPLLHVGGEEEHVTLGFLHLWKRNKKYSMNIQQRQGWNKESKVKSFGSKEIKKGEN